MAKKPILHENLALIEVKESIVLDALIADPEAGIYVATRLDDRRALVVPQYVDALVERLMAMGHTPMMQ